MKIKSQKRSSVSLYLVSTLFAAALFFTTAVTPVIAADINDAQDIVDRSKVTFTSMVRDKDFSWFRDNLKNAKGLLIYPQVLKAGFILGGSGGTGALVVRDVKTGDWSEPTFYTIGSVSFGLQIGGESAEVIMMVMSQKAVDSLFTSSVKLGGDTSIAVGPVGAGAKGAVTADIISFAKSKGLYAGLNFEGSVLGVRESLNKAYYGKGASPVEIIVEKKVSNKGADELRAALKKAVK
ncbi:MAG: lipid-binding SYLF domain-containing protein [Proteobacteria bacterium]|nr:lipid-binding SYLF domain-containing protein [Pseudomonadota bacterium]